MKDKMMLGAVLCILAASLIITVGGRIGDIGGEDGDLACLLSGLECMPTEVCVDGQCITPSACGNGIIESGEQCDAPRAFSMIDDGVDSSGTPDNYYASTQEGISGQSIKAEMTSIEDVQSVQKIKVFLNMESSAMGVQADIIIPGALQGRKNIGGGTKVWYSAEFAPDAVEEWSQEDLNDALIEIYNPSTGKKTIHAIYAEVSYTDIGGTQRVSEIHPNGERYSSGWSSSSGPNLNGKNCITQGFQDGLIRCRDNCQFDLSGCIKCGDGVVNQLSEACDGSKIRDDKDCTQVTKAGGGSYNGGILSCTATCGLNTAGCTYCGDGAINSQAGEECEGTNLNGGRCQQLGYTFGTLTCDSNCKYDISNCQSCDDQYCQIGEKKCSDDKKQVLTCQTSINNPCKAYAATQNCPAGQECDQGSCKGILYNTLVQIKVAPKITEDITKQKKFDLGEKIELTDPPTGQTITPPTPPAAPTAPAICGNNICDAGETAASCRADCFACTPKTCEDAAIKNKCGLHEDGCGNQIECLTCPATNICNANRDCAIPEESNPGLQSKIDNFGKAIENAKIILKVEYFNGRDWILSREVYRDATPRTIAPGTTVKLDEIWDNNVLANDGFNTREFAGDVRLKYRVAVDVVDNDGRILKDINNNPLTANDEFQVNDNPICGNGEINAGETCSSCPADACVNTAPEIGTVAFPATSGVGKEIAITAEVTDAQQNKPREKLDRVEIEVLKGGKPILSNQRMNGIYPTFSTVPFKLFEPGNYEFEITATDKKGETDSRTGTIHVGLDATIQIKTCKQQGLDCIRKDSFGIKDIVKITDPPGVMQTIIKFFSGLVGRVYYAAVPAEQSKIVNNGPAFAANLRFRIEYADPTTGDFREILTTKKFSIEAGNGAGNKEIKLDQYFKGWGANNYVNFGNYRIIAQLEDEQGHILKDENGYTIEALHEFAIEPTCGDGSINQQSEECEGTNFKGNTCRNYDNTNGEKFDTGNLRCSDACIVETIQCTNDPTCLDGNRNGEETDIDCGGECGGCLEAKKCEVNADCIQGYICQQSGQEKTCQPAPRCGDNTKNRGVEECDGPDLQGQGCQSRGYTAGTLSCKSDCTFDETECTKCGNNNLEPPPRGQEQCDKNDLGGKTCTDVDSSFTRGQLGCAQDCTYDTSKCSRCVSDAACDAAGTTSCTEDHQVKTCVDKGFGCLQPSEPEDCPAGQMCKNSQCEATEDLIITLKKPKYRASSTRTVPIEIATDRKAECRYAKLAFSFENMQPFAADATKKIHRLGGFIIGSGNTKENMHVKCKDEFTQEIAAVRYAIEFDDSAPDITDPFARPNPIFEPPEKTTLRLATNEPAICKYDAGNAAYSQMQYTFTGHDEGAFKTEHEQETHFLPVTEDNVGITIACANKAGLVKNAVVDVALKFNEPFKITKESPLALETGNELPIKILSNRRASCTLKKDDGSSTELQKTDEGFTHENTFSELADGDYSTEEKKWEVSCTAPEGEADSLPVRFMYYKGGIPQVCTDSLQNGEESDTDCGGTQCDGCGVEKFCNSHEDCASGLSCIDLAGTKKCKALCGDGHIDGGEGCDDGNLISGDGCSDTCADEDVITICNNEGHNGITCQQEEQTICDKDSLTKVWRCAKNNDKDICLEPAQESCPQGKLCDNNACVDYKPLKIELVKPQYAYAASNEFLAQVRTSRKASCRFSNFNVIYDNMALFDGETNNVHTINRFTITGNKGSLFVKCIDPYNQQEQSDSFPITIDSVDPKISKAEARPNPITEPPERTTLFVATDKGTACKYDFDDNAADKTFQDMNRYFTEEWMHYEGDQPPPRIFPNLHRQVTQFLTLRDTPYTFTIQCMSRSGLLTAKKSVVVPLNLRTAFTVEDTTTPSTIESSIDLQVKTSKKGTCKANFGVGELLFNEAEPSLEHSYRLTNLQDGDYEIPVTCESTQGEEATGTVKFNVKIGGTPETCNDKLLNQDETGMDCGGKVCNPCKAGEKCNTDNDCEAPSSCKQDEGGEKSCQSNCGNGRAEPRETCENCKQDACPEVAPDIEVVSLAPEIQGLGRNVDLTFSVKDKNNDLKSVSLTVNKNEKGDCPADAESCPDRSITVGKQDSFSLDSDVHEFSFKSHKPGTYQFLITATDSLEQMQTMAADFKISYQGIIQLHTKQKSYSLNDMVEITDPPEAKQSFTTRLRKLFENIVGKAGEVLPPPPPPVPGTIEPVFTATRFVNGNDVKIVVDPGNTDVIIVSETLTGAEPDTIGEEGELDAATGQTIRWVKEKESEIQKTYTLTYTYTGTGTAAGTITSGAGDIGTTKNIEGATALTGCIALLCTDVSIECGEVDDGCGGVINCNTCAPGRGCQSNRCVDQPECGDTIKNQPDEDCDSTDFGGMGCDDLGLGFTGGRLECRNDCTIDTRSCTTCGKDGKEAGEACDGDDVGTQTCAGTSGYTAGALKCTAQCELDTSQCTTCGNGNIEGAEECDGRELGGKDCTTIGLGYQSGTLQCTNGCVLDTRLCAKCGDGKVNQDTEECDGSKIRDDKDCTGYGFNTGTLTCDADCKIVTSNCGQDPTCGDDLQNQGESDIDCGGINCPGCTAGKTCNAKTDCQPSHDCIGNKCVKQDICGDVIIDSGEMCDGTKLNSKTCSTEGYTSGNLACSEDCKSFDFSDCRKCGDGIKNQPTEQCDKKGSTADLGGETCVSQKLGDGDLDCDINCRFDTRRCTSNPSCSDGAKKGNETDTDCGGECAGCERGKNCDGDGDCKSGDICKQGICAAAPRCGDRIKNQPDEQEECDKGDLSGNSCFSLGYSAGTLSCNNDCRFITSLCTKCGNSVCESGETSCLGDCPSETPDEKQSKIVNTGETVSIVNLEMTLDYYNATRESWKLEKVIFNGSARVDNKVIKLDHYFNGIKARELKNGFGTYRVYAGLKDDAGEIIEDDKGKKQNASAEFAFAAVCGDKIKNQPDEKEECDTEDLQQHGCENITYATDATGKDLTYDEGTLSCTAGCAFNTSSCIACNNACEKAGETVCDDDYELQTCQIQQGTTLCKEYSAPRHCGKDKICIKGQCVLTPQLVIKLNEPVFRASPTQSFPVEIETSRKAECRFAAYDLESYDNYQLFPQTGSRIHRVSPFNISFIEQNKGNIYAMCNDTYTGEIIKKKFLISIDPNRPLVTYSGADPSPLIEPPERTKLIVETDRPTLCTYDDTFTDTDDYYGLGYAFEEPKDENFKTVHKINTDLLNLEKLHYDFKADCITRANLTTQADIIIPLDIKLNTTFRIRNINTLPYVIADPAVIDFTTNKRAACFVLKDNERLAMADEGLNHKLSLPGLENNDRYEFRVTCTSVQDEDAEDKVIFAYYKGGLPANCSDNIQNRPETDIDCGGDECEPCGYGKICATTDDCAVGNSCLLNSTNGKQCVHTCGNEAIDEREECDDGNLDDGDGCSGTCLAEAIITSCKNQKFNETVCDREGKKTCDGFALRTCGNYDQDACFEWDEPKQCAAGKMCFNASCIAEQPLTIDLAQPQYSIAASKSFDLVLKTQRDASCRYSKFDVSYDNMAEINEKSQQLQGAANQITGNAAVTGDINGINNGIFSQAIGFFRGLTGRAYTATAATDPASCTPSCESKECGFDSCAGSCGTCGDGNVCKKGKCEASTEDLTQGFDPNKAAYHTIKQFTLDRMEGIVFAKCKDSYKKDEITSASFILQVDDTPPAFLSGQSYAQPNPIVDPPEQTTLFTSTDEDTSCKFDLSEKPFNEMKYSFAGENAYAARHQQATPLLAINQKEYTFFVKCQNKAGLISQTQIPLSITLEQPFAIREILTPDIILGNKAALELTTNKQADCTYGPDKKPMQKDFLKHSAVLSQISKGHYEIPVECISTTREPAANKIIFDAYDDAAMICSDGKQNRQETDTDCGGKECKPCEANKKCGVIADCALGTSCLLNTDAGRTQCTPTCGDGTLNAEHREQCDDGNLIAGDGCSDTCAAEDVITICQNETYHSVTCEKEGQQICDGYAIRTCTANADNDICLDISPAATQPAAACPAGQICEDNRCGAPKPFEIRLAQPAYSTAKSNSFPVQLQTTRKGHCKYSSRDVTYANMQDFSATDSDRHTLDSYTITGASGNLYVKCEDDYTKEIASNRFIIDIDREAAKISGLKATPNPIIEVPEKTTISFSTDKPTICKFDDQAGNYQDMQYDFPGNKEKQFTTEHAAETPYLAIDVPTHTFSIACLSKAELETTATTDVNINLEQAFKIKSLTEPFLTEELPALTVATNKQASCTAQEEAKAARAMQAASATQHSLSLGTMPNGIYTFTVSCTSTKDLEKAQISIPAEIYRGGAAAHCNNNIKDRDETDVDCGGSRCAPCDAQKRCEEHADCKQGTSCENTICSVCSNQCENEGQQICDGYQIRKCGDSNADTCLEWLEPQQCATGELCQNDQCGKPLPFTIELIEPGYSTSASNTFDLGIKTSRKAICRYRKFDVAYNNMIDFDKAVNEDAAANAVTGAVALAKTEGRIGFIQRIINFFKTTGKAYGAQTATAEPGFTAIRSINGNTVTITIDPTDTAGWAIRENLAGATFATLPAGIEKTAENGREYIQWATLSNSKKTLQYAFTGKGTADGTIAGGDPAIEKPIQGPTALCMPECAGKQCGGDGCGGSCGSCESSEECRQGICVAESLPPPPPPAPGCISKSCQELETQCGTITDNCGKQVNCGTCQQGFNCETGQCTEESPPPPPPTPGGCIPKSCQELETQCGTITDNCGKQVNCGTCQQGFNCETGQCTRELPPEPDEPGCMPKRCKEQGAECGPLEDGCGSTKFCGTCSLGTRCDKGKCVATDDTEGYTLHTASNVNIPSEQGRIYVACKDTFTQEINKANYLITIDTTEPQITAKAEPQEIVEPPEQTTFTVTTDDPTICKFDDAADTLEQMRYEFPGFEKGEFKTAHQALSPLLAIDTENQSFNIRCMNKARLSAVEQVLITVKLDAPFEITKIHTPKLVIDDNTILDISTNKQAQCSAKDGQKEITLTAKGVRHSSTVSGLSNGDHAYPVSCSTINGENDQDTVMFSVHIGGIPENCTDGIRNKEETDIDCGGNECKPCGFGGDCSKDADCALGANCLFNQGVGRTQCTRTCGNGNIDPREECDDNNMESGDGCSAACVNESVITTCTDGCTEKGASSCEGFQTRICGDYDRDICLEWGESAACSQGQLCQDKACEPFRTLDIQMAKPAYATAAGSKFAVELATPRKAHCRYANRDVSYENMNEFTTSDDKKHGLNEYQIIGKKGNIYVKCKDSYNDDIIGKRFVIEIDPAPAAIQNLAATPNPILEVPEKTTISFSTDKPTICTFDDKTELPEQMRYEFPGFTEKEFKTMHQADTPLLAIDVPSHTFNIACQSKAGLISKEKLGVQINLEAGFSITDHTQKFIIEDKAMLNVSTNKQADCIVDDTAEEMMPDANMLKHTLTLESLKNGDYTPTVKCVSTKDLEEASITAPFNVYIGGIPENCTDGIRNKEETDIDCGGSACAWCGADKSCSSETDCSQGLTCNQDKKCASCSNQCSSGQTACDGYKIQSCGDLNNDQCLEYGAAQECSQGEICENSKCGPITDITITPKYPAFGIVPNNTFDLAVGTSRAAECRVSRLNRNFESMDPFTETGGTTHTSYGFNIPRDTGGIFVKCNDPLLSKIAEYQAKITVDKEDPRFERLEALPNPITDSPEKTTLFVTTNKETICSYEEQQKEENGINGTFAGHEHNQFAQEHEALLDTFDVSRQTYLFNVNCSSKAGRSTKSSIEVELKSDELFRISKVEIPFIVPSPEAELQLTTNKKAQCSIDLIEKEGTFEMQDRLHYRYRLNELEEGEYEYSVNCFTDNFEEDSAKAVFRVFYGGENCTDRIQNQFGTASNESDVDCGGIICEPCQESKKCDRHQDCADQLTCQEGVCVKTCGNGQIDEGELCSRCPEDVGACPDIAPQVYSVTADAQEVEVGESVLFSCKAHDQETLTKLLNATIFLKENEQPYWNLIEGRAMQYDEEKTQFTASWTANKSAVGQGYTAHCEVSDGKNITGITNQSLGLRLANSKPIATHINYEPIDAIKKIVRFECWAADENEDERSLSAKISLKKNNQDIINTHLFVEAEHHAITLQDLEEGAYDTQCNVSDSFGASDTKSITSYNVSYNKVKDYTKPVLKGASYKTQKNQLTVTWETDEATSGTLLADDRKNNRTARKEAPEYDTSHVTTVSGLAPATDYTLIIIYRDPSGNQDQSAPRLFTTNGSDTCLESSDCDANQVCLEGICRKEPKCGDNVADYRSYYQPTGKQELCDGADPGGISCTAFPGYQMFNFTGGKVSCITPTQTCGAADVNVSRCYRCNNGTVEAGEQCEAGMSIACSSLGLGVGTASCGGECQWNVSSCSFCGNKKCEPEKNENFRSCGIDCGGEGAPCTSDFFCEDAFECMGGICRETIKIECKQNSQCTKGYVCNAFGNCIVYVPPPECTANENCKEGFKCAEGKCVQKAEGRSRAEETAISNKTVKTFQEACAPDWLCSGWSPSDCPAAGKQTRKCVSKNGCLKMLPTEEQQCVPSALEPRQPARREEPRAPAVERPQLPAASCSDSIRNQGESGVDCGGPCTPCKKTICGDDICDEEESADTCPEDCKKGTSPFLYIIPAILAIVLVGGITFYRIHNKKPEIEEELLPPPLPRAMQAPPLPPAGAFPKPSERLAAMVPRRPAMPVQRILPKLQPRRKDEKTFERLGDIITAKETAEKETQTTVTQDIFSRLGSLKPKGKLIATSEKIKAKMLTQPKLSSEERINNLKQEIEKTKKKMQEEKYKHQA